MVTVVQISAEVDWSLGGRYNPETVPFRLGDLLPAVLKVKNTSAGDRELVAYIFLADAGTGQVIEGTLWWLLLEEGSPFLPFAAGQQRQFSGLVFAPTDFATVAGFTFPLPSLFGVTVQDWESKQFLATRTVRLEPIPPSLLEQLMPLMGVGLIGLAIGMVLPAAFKMFRRQ